MLRTHNQRLVLLILILLLAAFTRIITLGQESLWSDETFTWYVTQYPDPLKVLLSDVHPPVYFYLMVGWVKLVGTSEIALRYFSTLVSFLSIATIYQLAREIEWQRRIRSGGFISVVAALLLALTDVENHLAQETRSYTLQTVWICLSMWGFLRWTRTGGRGWLALWAINLILLIYTFYLGAALGIVQGVYALLFLRGTRRVQAIGTLVGCALALLPWVAVVVLGGQTQNLSYVDWIKPNAFVFAELREIYFTRQWALNIGLAALGVVTIAYSHQSKYTPPLTPPRRTLRQRLFQGGESPPLLVERGTGGEVESPHLVWHKWELGVLLLLWLILPLVLTFALNVGLPLYTPRRVSQIAPAIALLMAFGLGNLRSVARWLLVIVLIVYGVSSVDFSRYKQPWNAFIGANSAYITPDDLALAEMAVGDFDGMYYLEKYLPDNEVRGLLSWRRLEGMAAYETGIAGLLPNYDVVWMLYWSQERAMFYWFNDLPMLRTADIVMPTNPDVHLYRYEKLPEKPLASFANGMILQAARIVPEKHLIGLTWTTTQLMTTDYVTSVALLDETGKLVAQQDSPPALAQRPTATWTTDEGIYDPKIWQTVDGQPLPAGKYQAVVVVYALDNGVPIRTLTVDGADMVLLGELIIE
jgi:4-amino-4-deoxy-L-arabinose transferase-like glycosyltransferase